MKAVILSTQDGDWEALYVDGRCVVQDHHIRTDVLTKALGFDLELRTATKEQDAEANDSGRFPETLP